MPIALPHLCRRLLLAVAFAQPALAADTGPRIVIQAAAQGGVEVAAWTPNDRYIVTATGLGRTVTIWEAATGIMIDHARLPAASGGGSGEFLRLSGIDIDPDGRRATVHGIAVDVSKGDVAQSREYSVDLATRRVTPLPPRALPASEGGMAAFMERITAVSTIYEQDKTLTIAQAEAKLPKLPASHDGRTRLRRDYYGLNLTVAGSPTRLMPARESLGFAGAALGPDGRRLVLVLDARDEEATGIVTTIERFDLTAASYAPAVRLAGDYDLVRWLDATRFLVTPATDSVDRTGENAETGTPPPGLILDAVSGRTLAKVAPHCFTQAFGDGTLVGAELANCRAGAKGGRGLAVYDLARGAWRPLAIPDQAKRFINYIAVAPKGTAMAVVLEDDAGKQQLLVFDRTTGAAINALDAASVFTAATFTADGRSLIVAGNANLATWKFADGEPVLLTAKTLVPEMMATDGNMLAVSGAGDDAIVRTNLVTGAALPPLELGRAIAGGFLAGKPVFWAVSAMDGLRLWDTRTWSVMLTTYQFADQKFLAVTPEGRYDTNLGPDADQFRWIVPDAPFQSLAPQTFMRDYFEPRLTQRILDCTTAGDCATALKPLASIAQLNRVLPRVRIAKVTQGATPAEALVDVEVREGIDPAAANGKTRSGVYNLRLFRANRYEGQSPAPPPEAVRVVLPAWRAQNRLAAPNADGVSRTRFTVALPTAAGSAKSVFTAYAFNEDRVKSDSASLTYTRPEVTAIPPRAFVLTIGIDAYDEPRLALQFAAGDATLLGDRLAAIPGYDTRRLTLAGERGADGTPRRITRETVASAIGLLGRGDRTVHLARLEAAGIDGAAIEAAGPDDVVIVTFAGHGWADAQGNFYLVPADGRWAGGGDPDTASLISASDLTTWLRGIAAADAAFIIDACHSAASVESLGFKPGPMGDPGLGQLAFDKGIRILAATQADDVALEDPGLRQGLLTYALAGEGIVAGGGKADLDGNGRIVLDEWLRYATRRLPSLSEDVRLGRYAAPAAGRARGFDLLDGTPAKRPKVQEPSLFDFTGAPSRVVLRTTAR